jgi:nitrogen fixation protein NifX
MIRVAFATDDQKTVNLHFGAAEQFVLYDVDPGVAHLVGIGRFVKARMKGINAERRPDEPAPAPDEVALTEDKVISKIEFLRSCSAVYAAKIGVSSIKRLMQTQIHPIIVNKGYLIVDLLNEVSLALSCGGLAWVESAQAAPKVLDIPGEIFTGDDEALDTDNLITSIDDIA